MSKRYDRIYFVPDSTQMMDESMGILNEKAAKGWRVVHVFPETENNCPWALLELDEEAPDGV